ncbi:hypothetical protein [Faecalispora anaeroviscerum]|uniref:hypothetical protein n=1 Tax=Faecalispora anaeroviscerum TaxID=2991836 RepID=UPI0024B9E4C8|nr:hypothetical protein [Faecalispora anaeroviscerum]
MTYKLLKRIIDSGNYNRDDVQNKMDVFLTFNRITQEEYAELQLAMGETSIA